MGAGAERLSGAAGACRRAARVVSRENRACRSRQWAFAGGGRVFRGETGGWARGGRALKRGNKVILRAARRGGGDGAGWTRPASAAVADMGLAFESRIGIRAQGGRTNCATSARRRRPRSRPPPSPPLATPGDRACSDAPDRAEEQPVAVGLVLRVRVARDPRRSDRHGNARVDVGHTAASHRVDARCHGHRCGAASQSWPPGSPPRTRAEPAQHQGSPP